MTTTRTGGALVHEPPAAPTPGREPGTRAKVLRQLTRNWVLLVLVALIVTFWSISGSEFFSVPDFRDILYNASESGVLAAGMTLVIIGGQIDLSVGSVLVFSSVIAAKVIVAIEGTGTTFHHPDVALTVGLLTAVVVGTAWGALNGVLVVALKIPSFIVTLGTLGMAIGLSDVITSGADIAGLSPTLQTAIGARQVLGVPLLVIITAAIMVVAGIVLARTCFGRYTYAIGSNAEAARRAGIKVGRHVVVLFTIMGLLAGVAGAMDIARFTTTSVIAHGADNLIAIAAVVIGGASLFGGSGTMFRTAIGVLIPAVLTTGLIIANVQSFWQEVIIGAILICAVAIDNVKRSSETKAG